MLDLDWQFTLVLITNGVMIGLMYTLIALGFVLVYKATDAINFAQGEFVMFAGFIAAAGAFFAGLPFWICALLAIAGMIGFGFGLERVVLRPLIGPPVVAVIMATIGVAAVPRAGHAAAGRARRRRGQPGLSRRLHLVLPQEPQGRRHAGGGGQPASGDGHGDQRAALFRPGLGHGRHRL